MKALKNKKNLLAAAIVLMLLLGGVILNQIENNRNQNKINLGETIYDEIHELYFYGKSIQYIMNEDRSRSYIEKENQKYYEIENYDEIFKSYFTASMLSKVKEYLNVIEEDGKYYMKDSGRGLSGYYGTTLKIKNSSKNKISFIAQSQFCEIDYRVTYGEGCRENHYYTIDKPFVIVKENGKWKVDEYTSVFEFKDTEMK